MSYWHKQDLFQNMFQLYFSSLQYNILRSFCCVHVLWNLLSNAFFFLVTSSKKGERFHNNNFTNSPLPTQQ